jgi:hypothetical protein
MKKEFFFGIDPLNYTYRVNNPLKQSELALHLFCNLKISAKRGLRIFYESVFLLPEGFDALIEKVKADYHQQERFPLILEDDNLFSQFKNKIAEWIELNNLPNLDDLYRALEVLGFPDSSFDHLLNNALQFEFEFLDEHVFWLIMGEKRCLTKQQKGRLAELNRCIFDKLPPVALEEQLIHEGFCPQLEHKPSIQSIPTYDESNRYLNEGCTFQPEAVVMGIDFSAYPHVPLSIRKRLSQNLFAHHFIDTEKVHQILSSPAMVSACGRIIETFDCSTICLESSLFPSWDKEDFFESQGESLYSILKQQGHTDPELLSNSVFREAVKEKMIYMFLMAEKLLEWSAVFSPPTLEELRDSLDFIGVNPQFLVNLSALAVNNEKRDFELSSDQLVRFITAYSDFFEEENLNRLLDTYILLRKE